MLKRLGAMVAWGTSELRSASPHIPSVTNEKKAFFCHQKMVRVSDEMDTSIHCLVYLGCPRKNVSGRCVSLPIPSLPQRSDGIVLRTGSLWNVIPET